MHSDKNEDKHSIMAAHRKPLACREEQLDQHNVVRNSDKNLSTDWKEELKIQDEYSAYRDKFIYRLKQFEST